MIQPPESHTFKIKIAWFFFWLSTYTQLLAQNIFPWNVCVCAGFLLKIWLGIFFVCCSFGFFFFCSRQLKISTCSALYERETNENLFWRSAISWLCQPVNLMFEKHWVCGPRSRSRFLASAAQAFSPSWKTCQMQQRLCRKAGNHLTSFYRILCCLGN